MHATALRGLLVLAAALALATPARASLSVLDNGRVRVGVDLVNGGKITWLSRAGGDHAQNLVFESEQSYYGGPSAADGSQLWHAYQDTAFVVAHRNDGRTLFVRAFDYSCECTLETWITLVGDAAVVRNRLTSFRSDTTTYPPSWQELPALYATGGLYRVVTYDGASPYTQAPARDVTAQAQFPLFTPQHLDMVPTEHWVALVDAFGFGVGLVEPDVSHFIGIAGDPFGQVSAYAAGVRQEQLDANVVYEYTYALVAGSLAQIRAYAYAHRPDPRPNYVFRRDRQHFIERNTIDAGFPIRGALRLRLDQADPQLIGPEQAWQASAVPRLYVRGAWHSRQTQPELSWSRSGESVAGSRPFRIVADGTFHTYRVDLFREPRYSGTITGLRLDPAADAEPGGWVDVTCISWRPCPIDRTSERALLNDHGFVPFLDGFDRLDTTFWSVTGNSPEATAIVAGGELGIDVPADAKPLSGQDYISTGVYSRCTLEGDFDARVDYSLPIWPEANGVNVNFSVGNRTLFRHNGPGTDGISSYFPPFPGGAYAPDSRSAGTLRFVRSGDFVTALYRDDLGGWQRLDGAHSTRDPVNVSLSIYTNRPIAGAQDVTVAFDNFRVTRGRIDCP